MTETSNGNGTTDYLLSCVSSLRKSTELLDKSINLVDETTKDVPRLKKILRTENVFGLISEQDLNHSIKTVQNELQPKVDILATRYEQELIQLRNKRNNLKNKIELQKVRLQNINKGDKNINDDKLLRINFLQNKKNRLEFLLSKYQLQDQQERISLTKQSKDTDDEKDNEI